jgi:spermidine synthase
MRPVRKQLHKAKGPRSPDFGESMGLSIFVAGCFFVSGAAGLAYEVLWVRLIDKVIGGAPFAVAMVLSVVMAGLGLGGYLAGRNLHRIRSRAALLALYGKLELGIGLFALAVPFGIRVIEPVYRAIYDPLISHLWCYPVAAFVGSAIILIVPTAFMGATLPVLCRFYVLRLTHVGARTGWLYGLNTAGAAVGTVLCGFFLIEHLGVWRTLGVFAAVNFVLGLGCLFVSWKLLPQNSRIKKKVDRESALGVDTLVKPPENSDASWQRPWVLAIFVGSGFCAMAYEVLWTRLLGLIAGPTTYSFTLVVATFIIGLALGSILFGRIADKAGNPFLWLVGCQLGAALSALAVSQLLGNSQFFFAKLIHAHQDRFSHLMLFQSLVLFAILLIPTLFLGAAFPLVNRLYIRSMDRLAFSLGKAYALNTIGAISGSITAGFLMIPWMGKAGGLRLVIGLQFLQSSLALWRAGKGSWMRPVAVGIALVGIGAAIRYPAWHTDLLSRGWYRDFGAIEQTLSRTGWLKALWEGSEAIEKQRRGLEVVFQGEGVAGFTTVEREETSLGTVEFAMFNSGKADASSHGDRSTQALSAHIPLLFHPDAKKVMVLGLASGMTVGEALLYPIQKMDVVEINAQVVAACRRFFSRWNNHCLDDPRTRLIIQDGRNHLALTHDTYDVIISEPSNPWMAGLANLYSKEFFELAGNRLTADGLFAQWIQSYEMDWETFSLLGRTFCAVFPRGGLIKVGPVDYLLLGFKNPDSGFNWDVARNHGVYARSSKNVAFPPDMGFLVNLILTEDLADLFGPGPLHTDNRPYLEFSAPTKLYGKRLDIDAAAASHRRLTPDTKQFADAHRNIDTLVDLVVFSASANVPMFNVLPWSQLEAEHQTRYERAMMDYCGRVLVPSYGIFSDPTLKARCAQIQMTAINQKIAAGTPNPNDFYNLALAQIAAWQPTDAIRRLKQAISLDTSHEAAMTTLGLLLAESGDLSEAARVLSMAVTLSPEKAAAHQYLGMVKRHQGEMDAALRHLSAAHAISPDNSIILSELGAVCMAQGNYSDAVSYLTHALQKDPKDEKTGHDLRVAKRLLGEKNPYFEKGSEMDNH